MAPIHKKEGLYEPLLTVMAQVLPSLEFPNVVVLYAVVRRNMHMSAKERKRKPAKERKRALPRKNCKQPVV